MEKKDMKKIVIVIVAIIAVIAVSFIAVKMIGSAGNKNKEILKYIESDKDIVIYVTDNKNKDVDKYIKDKNIKVETFIVKEDSKADYDKLLKKYGLQKDVFGTPAIILVKEGKMYANIINVSSTKVIDQFIKDYKIK